MKTRKPLKTKKRPPTLTTDRPRTTAGSQPSAKERNSSEKPSRKPDGKPTEKSGGKPGGNLTGKPDGKLDGKPKNPAPTQPGFRIPKMLYEAWEASLVQQHGGRLTGVSTNQAILQGLSQRTLNAMRSMWHAYNLERDQLRKFLLSTEEMGLAYMLAQHLPNLGRNLLCLERLSERVPLREKLPTFTGFNLVDLGCGSGAMSLSTLAYLRSGGIPEANSTIQLLDTSKPLLASAIAQLNELDFKGRVVRRACSLNDCYVNELFKDQMPHALQVVSAGFLLNEINRNRQALRKLHGIIGEAIHFPALLVFIEPARSQESRQLMEFRQEVIDSGYQVLYPCPQSLSCPMLERSRDWCFSEAKLERSRHERFIDNLLDRDSSHLVATAHYYASPRLVQMLGLQKAGSVIVGRPLLKSPGSKVPPGAKSGTKPQPSVKMNYLLCQNDGELSQTPSRASPFAGSHLYRGEVYSSKKVTEQI